MNFKIAHIGLNAKNKEDLKEILSSLSLLGFASSETVISTFMGDEIEVMHQNGRGTNGHIAFTPDCSVQEATDFLTSKGFTIIPETRKFDAEGNLTFVYFNEQICGFAIHLVK